MIQEKSSCNDLITFGSEYGSYGTECIGRYALFFRVKKKIRINTESLPTFKAKTWYDTCIDKKQVAKEEER